ncbi:MAG: PAS domain S-box protein [Desulfobacterales bacterium]
MLHIKGLSGTVKGLLDHAFSLNYQLSMNPIIVEAVDSADEDWDQRVRKYRIGKKTGNALGDRSGESLLVTMQKRYDFVELFFAQDIKGDQVARSFGDLGHRGQRWWFKKFIEEGHKPFISKSYYSITGDKPVTSVFHGIWKNGRIVGVMGTDINFAKLQEMVHNYLNAKDLSAIVLDNAGVIIAHPDQNKLREMYNLKNLTRNVLVKNRSGGSVQNQTGYHRTRDVQLDWSPVVSDLVTLVSNGESGFADNVVLEGVNTKIYYESIPLPGDYGSNGNYAVIMIRDNSSLTVTKFWLCALVFLFTALFTFFLFFLFHIQFRKVILSPLKKLTLSMQDMDSLAPKEVIIDTNDEFQTLAETYNRMLRKLGKARSELFSLNEELEKRVESRTEELKEANRRLQQDIVAREKIEKALRESEDRYRKIFKAAPDSIMIIRIADRKFIDVNEAFCVLSGRSREEIIGKTPADLNIVVDQSDMEKIRKTLVERIEVSGLEIECRRKDGTTLNTIVSARSLNYGDEECLIAILTDITARKQIEASLQESEEKYRLLAENANDAIFIVQNGRILFPNPKAVELGKYLGSRSALSSYFDYIHPEERKMIIERHLKRISGESLPEICSFRLVTDSGKELWVELNDVSIFWGGRPAILSFLRDITAQKKMESRVEKAQRMDSIGTLAGGIAHNFNNLLMGIQGNLSLILLNEEMSQHHQDELKSIERCIENGANLTKQLLGFARGGKYFVTSLNPNKIIYNTSKMFAQSKREIKIHSSFEKNIWTIEADQGQIELVLLNIYVNAAQAMEKGGDLYLKTENVVFSESEAAFLGISAGKYVKMSIADTGPGIDKKVLEKIFEPFYTTKEVGEGTGLGLASAFGIVKNHGGFIDVETNKNEGARFDVFLPATEKKYSAEDIPVEHLEKGTETILLIDDETIVIDVCRSMLKELGYEVIVARGGKAAIEIYAGKKENISLVILDIIMPDMDGEKVFDKIREINPRAKVLLSSGCSIDAQASAILSKGCDGFIQKPFKIKQLSLSVREILGKD